MLYHILHKSDVCCVCVTSQETATTSQRPTVPTKPYPAQKTLYIEVEQSVTKKTASSEPRPVSQYPEDAASSSDSQKVCYPLLTLKVAVH